MPMRPPCMPRELRPTISLALGLLIAGAQIFRWGKR